MRKYNQKFLKSHNQGLILKILREKGPITRAQISKEIGIVRSSVSEITNEMVDLGIINEGKKVKGNLGKRPTLLYFNKDFYYFISVAITEINVIVSICNLNGEIIREETMDFNNDITAREILDSVFSIIDREIKNLGHQKICLISLGSPETLNIRTGKIKWSPYIKDWLGMDLKELFKKKFNVEVILKDHMKLETMGEHWKSYNNVDNLVYIIITKGIGSGAIIDGKIREGKNGYLGEIAFLPISQNINFDDLKNRNNDLGYFESKCDINQIISLVKDYYKNSDIKINTIEEVAQLYKDDDNIKNLINSQIVRTLALGIASVIIVLDPEIVVINGAVVLFGDDFLNYLTEEIYNIIPYRRKVVFSELKNKACIYGAIKNGLEHIEKMLYENPDCFYSFDGKNNIKTNI
jgi:predicted NBD/HSP70 family sugar kinase